MIIMIMIIIIMISNVRIIIIIMRTFDIAPHRYKTNSEALAMHIG